MALNEAVKNPVFRARQFGFARFADWFSRIERSCPRRAAISPNFVINGRPPVLDATLFAPLLPQICLRQLLNVVHHAVQVSLRVDLGASPVVQPGQAFVVPDVAKHRLHGADALAVKLPAPG